MDENKKAAFGRLFLLFMRLLTVGFEIPWNPFIRFFNAKASHLNKTFMGVEMMVLCIPVGWKNRGDGIFDSGSGQGVAQSLRESLVQQAGTLFACKNTSSARK